MGTYVDVADIVDFELLFNNIKTIAIAGYSHNPQRAGHYVPQYLASQGYEVLAVNPRLGAHIDGLLCYPDLASIPADKHIDVVDVFRAPEFVPQLVEELAERRLRPAYFWMQLGAENPLAAERCRELGIVPVMYTCMLAAHKLLNS